MKCSRKLKSGSTFLQMIQVRKEKYLLSKKHQSSDSGAFYMYRKKMASVSLYLIRYLISLRCKHKRSGGRDPLLLYPLSLSLPPSPGSRPLHRLYLIRFNLTFICLLKSRKTPKPQGWAKNTPDTFVWQGINKGFSLLYWGRKKSETRFYFAHKQSKKDLRWLKTVSSTKILMSHYNHTLFTWFNMQCYAV